MAIKITSDSTCDLAKELLEKHDIELFPLYITLGGKTLRDGVEITPDDIFAHVAAGGALASTAAVTPNDYETRFAQLSREYDAVIHINISSDFSACHQNARIAAENYKNVYVVDSRNLSSGHGHVVMEDALYTSRVQQICRVVYFGGLAAAGLWRECRKFSNPERILLAVVASSTGRFHTVCDFCCVQTNLLRFTRTENKDS